MTILPHPLSEGALAELATAMRILSASDRHIDSSIGALEHCKVPFDHAPFKQALQCLAQAHEAISAVVVAHLDAINAQKKPQLTESAVAQ
jgi:hypothetical protein